ncbi:GNAT family N-acetyltransferase [Nocardiopsis coralliicola]
MPSLPESAASSAPNPASAPDTVRPATAADLPAIADTLGAAFTDYAWCRWSLPDEGYAERLRAVQRYFAAEVGLPYGKVWTADSGAAVAVWSTPDRTPPPDVFTADEITALYGDRGSAVAEAEAVLDRYRPQYPCWFLATVGVRPEEQGRGLGRAVLAPGIQGAQAAGVPAFLETASLDNVALYQRLGFRVTAEVELPGGAPRTWCMERSPAT